MKAFVQIQRLVAIVGVYAAVIAVSFYLAYEIRFDFLVPPMFQADRLALILPVIGIKLIALVLVRQLGAVMTYFSVPDLVRLFWASTAASLVLLAPNVAGTDG